MRTLSPLLLGLAVVCGAAMPVRALTASCVPGGSLAAPHDFLDPATWSPAGVPGATTDLRLDAACAVRCDGVCEARTLKGTNPVASLEVGPGAELVLHGCDGASAGDYPGYECGGEAGFRFQPRGAPVYDSAADGDVVVRGAALPGSPERLRLVVSEPIDAAVGDWFQVRGGPERSQVHRIVDVDFSGCPAAAGCWIELQLFDPDMEFGRNPASAGYATGLGYVAAPGAAIRVAGQDAAPGDYDELDPLRCVEVCSARSGDDCTDASLVSRDHAYVGWYLGATPLLHPADPAAMGRRHLIVEVRDDVDEEIGPGSGEVDRVCFADPIGEWAPAAGFADLSAVIWPGFWPGDDFVIFRPATVRYAGLEGDGGLGFYAACVDADFAYFDNWARILAQTGTPACQRPFEDTVITSWQEGLPPAIVQQSTSCNSHSLQVWFYPALGGDRVAIVDTRTPVDTSATCDTGSGPADSSPDSGHHGVSLSQTRFAAADPPAYWLIRHAGDDGIIYRTNTLGPETFTLRGWTWWWMTHGGSGQLVDFGNSAPGQTVRIEDGRAVMWTGSLGCGGALLDYGGHVGFELVDSLYLDPQHEGSIAFGDDARFSADGLLAFGDYEGTCHLADRGELSHSYVRGWSRLFKTSVRGLEGVRFLPGDDEAEGSVLGVPDGTGVVVQDFVFTGLPAVSLVSPVCAGACSLALRDGFAFWPVQTTYPGVANFLASANLQLAAPLEGLAIQNRRLLRCSAGWGETGDDIGMNRVVGNLGGIAITEPASCPLAAPQNLLQTTDPSYPLAAKSVVDGVLYGPKGRVGLPADSPLPLGLDLADGFAVAALACSNRVDDDGDGAADYPADPGCAGPLAIRENPECDDGLDNDGDLAVDHPADPDCVARFDNREQRMRACGLGFELAPVLAVLLALRRRRGRYST
jgi:hypothetical protein